MWTNSTPTRDSKGQEEVTSHHETKKGSCLRSEKVQFLFVSHNKATMEAAHQLSGVTMREPGVSRLVSVDLEEAARLAGAA